MGSTRREFLTTSSGLTGAFAAGLGRADERPTKPNAVNAQLPTSNSQPAASSDLVRMDALALSHAIHAKKVSCREVMTAFLDHINRVNPRVNAIVSLQDPDDLLKQAGDRDAQLARGESSGWMHGFPHAVKDLAATKGIRTSGGSPLLDAVPDHDAYFVERLRKAGAILIGKTNAPEFGLGSQTYNTIFGTTLNAYDQTKTSGGSSGGAAVALALSMLPVADGSDMMGSLRNPAAFNNVIGFRPSYGRVASGPDEHAFVEQLSAAGPMGRSIQDVAMLLSVMAGPDGRAPFSIEQDPKTFTQPLARDFKGTRIAWLGDFGRHLSFEPGVLDLCRGAFTAFESIGCSVEEARPDYAPDRLWDVWLTLRHWLIAGSLSALYADPVKRQQMKPEAQWEVEGGLSLSAREAYNASVGRAAWFGAVGKLFAHYDYLLLPSAQVFPFDASVHWPNAINGVKMDTYHRWMEVVVPATLSGCPVIDVPVGFSESGLPMGLQIIGRHHADVAVLQLAYAYEQATNWVRDHPPALIAG